MALIKRNSDYALRALVYMARFPIGNRFFVKLIAKRQRLPVTFLRKIFQKLSQRKIVDSCRGPLGGFYLLKKPRQISLKEILESVQGRISLTDCLWDSDFCSRKKTCKIKKRLSGIQKRLIGLLDGFTLNDLLR